MSKSRWYTGTFSNAFVIFSGKRHARSMFSLLHWNAGPLDARLQAATPALPPAGSWAADHHGKKIQLLQVPQISFRLQCSRTSALCKLRRVGITDMASVW